ncbi:type 1 glycerol-3-phosphate oxidase [Dolosicoccus paucivorans]|uniref:type 1 glycerol-3-phosphate oxidase n=1 Tax=Dolosicoccus paucivorans TaxID=84521 RepID=UPI000892656E|nr:type 1 glycerol-3-phosphate oxidase [Dolosicoccus paucivorans]SDI35519.1 glycerol 3-phosphate oxidase [Dolosicoccus paucivorans]
MTQFSYLNREKQLEDLKNTHFDLVIIGGGITGAGLALQAAASGLKTALLEMQDFAEGTSSRSTKLVHGGIRYLKHFDVGVVADTVGERAVVQQIAPHIPKPDPMLLPIYDEPDTTFGLFELQVAMNMYDSLAGVESTPFKNRVLTKEEVLQEQPDLLEEGLIGGGIYLDFNNNDSRLVIENLKQAHEDGAVVVSRVEVVDFNYNDEGQIESVKVKDRLTDETFNVVSHAFINATGPWSDTIRELDTQDDKPNQMRPTKGVHLVVDNSVLKVKRPTYFDTGEEDGRMVFVIPRQKKTYFGTTDTDYDGDLAHPTVTQEDVDYLLRIVNRRFPEANITMDHIESSWAGLRPLIAGNQASDYNGGNNGSLPDDVFNKLLELFRGYEEGKVRRAEIEDSILNAESSLSESGNSPSSVSRGSDLSQSPSGLWTLAGGKITDYRKMAQGALKAIIEELNETTDQTFYLINSKTYPVSGGRFNAQDVPRAMETFSQLAMDKGLSYDYAQELAQLYGSNTQQVLSYLPKAKELAKAYNYPVHVALSLVYAVEEEMVYTLEDFFTRRTNYSLFNEAALADLIKPVAQSLVQLLDLPREKVDEMVAHFDTSREEYQLNHLKNN